MAVTPVTEQLIMDAYAAWLVMEGRARSEVSGAIFAMRMTYVGTKTYHGLNEHDLCLLVGGDVFATG